MNEENHTNLKRSCLKLDGHTFQIQHTVHSVSCSKHTEDMSSLPQKKFFYERGEEGQANQ